MNEEIIEQGHGFLEPTVLPEDYRFLGATKAPDVIVAENGQWDEWLPAEEMQKRNGLETMNCFPYTAEVLMEDLSLKRICEVKVGDYVMTHLGRSRRVTSVFKRSYKGPFVEAAIRTTPEPLVATSEHPILTGIGWKTMGQLEIGDDVVIPTTNTTIKDATIYSIERNPEFLWLLGVYLAEGSIGWEHPNGKPKNSNPKLKVRGSGNGRGYFCFSIAAKELDFAERIKTVVKTLFGIDLNAHVHRNGTSRVLYGYDVRLRDLFYELGSAHAGQKRLLARFMLLEPELQLHIVRGWLDGDGHRQPRRVQGVTISRLLAYQMQRILLRNDIKAYLGLMAPPQGNRQQAYSVDVYGAELNKLYGIQLFPHPSAFGRARFIAADMLIAKVYRVKSHRRKNIGVVYNIEVEEDNSYIVNSVAVHNCTNYSTLNCLEALIFRHYGELYNFSERYTGVLTETTPEGNEPNIVIEVIRKTSGLIPEEELPFDDSIRSWNEYYSPKPMTEEYLSQGKKWLSKWIVKHEWVTPTSEDMKEALKRSPLGASVFAWAKNADGLYCRPSPFENHWVMIYGYEEGKYWKVFDNYNSTHKRIVWDYPWKWLKRYHIEKVPQTQSRSRKSFLDYLRGYFQEILK